MEFVISSVKVSFNYMYKQIDGMAMGSPLGLLIANNFSWINFISENHKFSLRFCNADDKFTAFDNES